MANLGYQVGRGTIANILKENGIDPAPERGARTRWSTFLKAHWECLAATDFLSVEVLTLKGLITQYVLFFIDIASRSVHIAGVTPQPDSSWMTQIARNITDVSNGFLCRKRYLILDRDTKYSDAFCGILTREGIEVIRLPPRSPNFRMIFVGQASLRHAITEYVSHYHLERNHQGLGNQLLRPLAYKPHGTVRRASDSAEC